MDDTQWRRDDDWIGSAIEDSFVMVNVASGKYIALNPTANAIWAAIAEPRTPAEIAAHVRTEYDVPEAQCVAAVHRMLSEMQRLKLASRV